MAFVEDMSVFFGDFGLPVIFGMQSTKGILDAPGVTAQIIGLNVADNEYGLLITRDGLDPLPISGDAMEVDSVPYRVKSVEPVDDGKLLQVKLKKL